MSRPDNVPKTFTQRVLDVVEAVLPTVTIGAGQYEIHTVKEYVDLPEYAQGCRLAIALATMDL